jgi:hypothetical protein
MQLRSDAGVRQFIETLSEAQLLLTAGKEPCLSALCRSPDQQAPAKALVTQVSAAAKVKSPRRIVAARA